VHARASIEIGDVWRAAGIVIVYDLPVTDPDDDQIVCCRILLRHYIAGALVGGVHDVRRCGNLAVGIGGKVHTAVGIGIAIHGPEEA
jgi:hypothetical protein